MVVGLLLVAAGKLVLSVSVVIFFLRFISCTKQSSSRMVLSKIHGSHYSSIFSEVTCPVVAVLPLLLVFPLCFFTKLPLLAFVIAP